MIFWIITFALVIKTKNLAQNLMLVWANTHLVLLCIWGVLRVACLSRPLWSLLRLCWILPKGWLIRLDKLIKSLVPSSLLLMGWGGWLNDLRILWLQWRLQNFSFLDYKDLFPVIIYHDPEIVNDSNLLRLELTNLRAETVQQGPHARWNTLLHLRCWEILSRDSHWNFDRFLLTCGTFYFKFLYAYVFPVAYSSEFLLPLNTPNINISL